MTRLFPLAIAAMPFMALAGRLDPRASPHKMDPGRSQKTYTSWAGFEQWHKAQAKRERKARQLAEKGL